MTTKTKTDCKATGLCHYDSLTRTNFFNGMLLTDDQLRAEQQYHRDALRRLNRYLWGSGIVCGLEVKHTTGLCIQVQPGFALDCHGNALEVCKCITVDLSEVCKNTYGEGCAPEDSKELKKCLVIRYKEIEADPQQVLTSDDDCGSSSDRPKCQPSKYREGFCLELRDDCPTKPVCPEETTGKDGVLGTVLQYGRGRADDDTMKKYRERIPKDIASPPCPKCNCDCSCDDCAVCLATLTIHCGSFDVDVDDDCRRVILSPRLLNWLGCVVFANWNKGRPEPADPEQIARTMTSFSARPERFMWEMGAVALSSRGYAQLQDDVYQLSNRLATLEKAQGSKAKGKDQG
jgi:hypothetical protein